jgi:FkbM family methyltransferase
MRFEVESDKVWMTFDDVNRFGISMNRLGRKDMMLLSLLDFGLRDSAIFYDRDHTPQINNNKSIRIVQGDETIIETSEGIKFFLDALSAVAIVEIFVRRIHDHYSSNLDGKVVLDIGASSGDTPLYFASKGAKVYAFEMAKTNYDEMIRNMELNPSLAQRIVPVHAAVGKDGQVEYFHDSRGLVSTHGSASLLKNRFGKYATKSKVEGMTIKTIMAKFQINQVELLKLDCKGCEFLLTKDDLQNIKHVKIEYYQLSMSHKVKSLTELLKGLGYKIIIFKHSPQDNTPMEVHGNILAERM